jgi:chromosome segregation ATPase
MFVKAICKEHLPIIIDSHGNRDNVRLLQDIFFDNLLLLRNDWFIKFIETSSQKVIPIQDKLQKELKSAYAERDALKKQLAAEGKKNDELETSLKESSKEVERLTSLVNELNNELSSLRNVSPSVNATQQAQQSIELSTPKDRPPTIEESFAESLEEEPAKFEGDQNMWE